MAKSELVAIKSFEPQSEQALESIFEYLVMIYQDAVDCDLRFILLYEVRKKGGKNAKG